MSLWRVAILCNVGTYGEWLRPLQSERLRLFVLPFVLSCEGESCCFLRTLRSLVCCCVHTWLVVI